MSSRVLNADVRTIVRVVLLVGLLLTFTVVAANFWAPANLYTVGQSFALLGLVAIGLALTMMSGEFDLSVAAVVALAGIVAVQAGESSALLGVAAALAVGALFGLANGLLIVLLRLSSLVVTVATLIVLTGLAYLLAGGRVVAYDDYAVGLRLDQPILEIFSLRTLITIGVILAVGFVLGWTQLGRDIRAAGSARERAEAAGVRAKRALVAAFVASSTFAALAGALLAFSLGSASPTTGSSLLLQAASAAIVGGIALVGGIGSAGGLAVGVLILTVLNSGLALLGASDATVSLANGIVLLSVVLLDASRVGRLSDLLARRPAASPEAPAVPAA